MSGVFLSASVPQPGRGDFHKTADPFLIQCAVRELLIAILGRRLLVWGGHPAITPMVWAACQELGVAYTSTVALYQSRFFESAFPTENKYFENVFSIGAVPNDRANSLLRMRDEMLSRSDLSAAVFIGGMEGVLEEYDLFRSRHPNARVVLVAGAGGAARDLAQSRGEWIPDQAPDLNFARLFHRELSIRPDEQRHTTLTL